MASGHKPNQTSFKPGHSGPSVSRRRLSEKITYTNLLKYGEKMFEILANEAINGTQAMSRIKAADKFLHHSLLQPKNLEQLNTEENKGVKLFILDFISKMQGKIPLENLSIMIEAAKEIEQKQIEEREKKEREQMNANNLEDY